MIIGEALFIFGTGNIGIGICDYGKEKQRALFFSNIPAQPMGNVSIEKQIELEPYSKEMSAIMIFDKAEGIDILITALQILKKELQGEKKDEQL
jgi:hypothetical protein